MSELRGLDYWLSRGLDAVDSEPDTDPDTQSALDEAEIALRRPLEIDEEGVEAHAEAMDRMCESLYERLWSQR